MNTATGNIMQWFDWVFLADWKAIPSQGRRFIRILIVSTDRKSIQDHCLSTKLKLSTEHEYIFQKWVVASNIIISALFWVGTKQG